MEGHARGGTKKGGNTITSGSAAPQAAATIKHRLIGVVTTAAPATGARAAASLLARSGGARELREILKVQGGAGVLLPFFCEKRRSVA